MHATKLVYVFKYRGLLVEPLSINGSIKLLIIYPRTFVNFETNCSVFFLGRPGPCFFGSVTLGNRITCANSSSPESLSCSWLACCLVLVMVTEWWSQTRSKERALPDQQQFVSESPKSKQKWEHTVRNHSVRNLVKRRMKLVRINKSDTTRPPVECKKK